MKVVCTCKVGERVQQVDDSAHERVPELAGQSLEAGQRPQQLDGAGQVQLIKASQGSCSDAAGGCCARGIVQIHEGFQTLGQRLQQRSV